jgi:hypothetical protein
MSDLTYRCIRWKSARDTTDTMLVRTFLLGCKPRFTCIKQLKRSTSLLYLKMSLPTQWPLIKSPTDPVDCSSVRYDIPHYGGASTIDLSIAASSALLLTPTAGRRTPVDCRLPTDGYFNYEVTIPDSGAECQANVSSSGKSVEVTSAGCQLVHPSYSCLESSIITHDATLIISETTASRNRSVLYCWLFLKPTSQATNFYLLNVTQCHQVMRTGAQLEQLHHYAAMFSTRRRRPLGGQSSSIRQISVTSTRQLSSAESTSPEVTLTSPTMTSREVKTSSDVIRAEVSPTETVPESKNPFVVSVAVIILAILQTILFCGCV